MYLEREATVSEAGEQSAKQWGERMCCRGVRGSNPRTVREKPGCHPEGNGGGKLNKNVIYFIKLSHYKNCHMWSTQSGCARSAVKARVEVCAQKEACR